MVENEKAVLSGDTNVSLKIAHITLCFENVKLQTLLAKRGALITNGKVEKIPEVDTKIRALVELDKDKLSKPVSAFITFQT